jgi:hypothetical protein
MNESIWVFLNILAEPEPEPEQFRLRAAQNLMYNMQKVGLKNVTDGNISYVSYSHNSQYTVYYKNKIRRKDSPNP